MMTTNPALASEHPFSALIRASDREHLLAGILELVWDSTLGLPISLREHEESGLPADEPITIGSVQVTGNWPCTVAIAAPRHLAAECAARFFDRPADELGDADIMDAWGELTNQVGGNLKALIAPPTHLSMPDVMQGATFTYRVPRTRVLNELTFACLGSRVRVTVLRPEEG